MTQIKIGDKLYKQLSALAKKEFRTPELQLEFLLTQFFESKVPRIPSQASMVSRILDFSDEEAHKHQVSTEKFKNEHLNKQADAAVDPSKITAPKTDEGYDPAWSNSRQAYERKQAKESRKIPLPDKELLAKANADRNKGAK